MPLLCVPHSTTAETIDSQANPSQMLSGVDFYYAYLLLRQNITIFQKFNALLHPCPMRYYFGFCGITWLPYCYTTWPGCSKAD